MTEGILEIADARLAPIGVARAIPASPATPLTLPDRLAIFAFGVALQFNVLTSSFGLPFMRLSDLLPFLIIPWFLFRARILSAVMRRLAPIGLVLLLLVASLLFKSDIEQGDAYFTLVLLMYFVLAVQFVVLFDDPAGPDWFAAGILAGFVGGIGTLFAASAGIELTPYGLAVPTEGLDVELIAFLKDKLGGLWSGGNEAGHVFALAGAAAAYLWYRTGRSEIYVLYFLGLVASFPMTINRGGLILPAIFVVVIVRKSVSPYALMAAAAAFCAIVMVYAATDHMPLPEQFQEAIERRFLADGNTESNVAERLDTTFATLRIMATSPFGLGNVSMVNQLREMTGLGTPHNGIVSLLVQSGVFVALAFLVAVFLIVAKPRRYGPFTYYTVLFMMPSMMFEELSSSQPFLFAIAFVLAAAAALGQRRDRDAAPD